MKRSAFFHTEIAEIVINYHVFLCYPTSVCHIILKNFHLPEVKPEVRKSNFSGALRLMLTIAEKVKLFFFETNRLFFVRSWPKLLSCFFLFGQSSNLISKNFYYDTMQQYRCSNFSDVFCLNCNFVIDVAVKQLASGSSLKYEVSAVTMAAHKIFLKNQIFTVIVSLNSL